MQAGKKIMKYECEFRIFQKNTSCFKETEDTKEEGWRLHVNLTKEQKSVKYKEEEEWTMNARKNEMRIRKMNNCKAGTN